MVTLLGNREIPPSSLYFLKKEADNTRGEGGRCREHAQGISLGSDSDTGSIQGARLPLTNEQAHCSPAPSLFSLCFWLIPSLWCQLF